jgi:nucleoid DNA-binding protein
MAAHYTQGVSLIRHRVHKKTGYHIDDVSKIMNAMVEEIRILMEEGKTRRIYFEKLGSFDLVKTRPRRAYNFQTKEHFTVQPMLTPKFRFNKEMVATIKKIKIDNG